MVLESAKDRRIYNTMGSQSMISTIGICQFLTFLHTEQFSSSIKGLNNINLWENLMVNQIENMLGRTSFD